MFDTIYPGWYRGRTPHIHLKVHVGGNEVHTGQLFFRDSISAAVYETRHYRSRGDAADEQRRGRDLRGGLQARAAPAARRRLRRAHDAERGGVIACRRSTRSARRPRPACRIDPPPRRRRDAGRVRARVGRDRVRRLDGRAGDGDGVDVGHGLHVDLDARRPPTDVPRRTSCRPSRPRSPDAAMDSEHLFWITQPGRGGRRAAGLERSGHARPADGRAAGPRPHGGAARRRTRRSRSPRSPRSSVHALALLGDGFLSPSLADVTIPFVSGYQRLWTTDRDRRRLDADRGSACRITRAVGSGPRAGAGCIASPRWPGCSGSCTGCSRGPTPAPHGSSSPPPRP